MRTVIITKWDGLTSEHYEKMRKSVNWEGNKPQGMVFHVAAFDKNGIRVTDVWESEDDYSNFLRTRLMPGAAAAGIKGEPRVDILPLHALFAPTYEASLRETSTSNSKG